MTKGKGRNIGQSTTRYGGSTNPIRPARCTAENTRGAVAALTGISLRNPLEFAKLKRAERVCLALSPALTLRTWSVLVATHNIIGGRSHGRTPPGTPTIEQRWVAAKARGDKTFDPGVACVNGHTSLRWANNGICIDCKRARDSAYNAAHKEEHRARARRSAASRPEAVKAYRKKYYWDNADVAKRRTREWQVANPERTRKVKRDWHTRNNDHVNARARARHALNPELMRASGRKWKRKNVAKVRAADSLRRAREVGAQVGDRRAYAVFVAWARATPSIRCYWCKKMTQPGRTKRHLDHIVPITKGGADSVGNLCVACPPCNLRKNAKMPEDFAGQSEMMLA